MWWPRASSTASTRRNGLGRRSSSRNVVRKSSKEARSGAAASKRASSGSRRQLKSSSASESRLRRRRTRVPSATTSSSVVTIALRRVTEQGYRLGQHFDLIRKRKTPLRFTDGEPAHLIVLLIMVGRIAPCRPHQVVMNSLAEALTNLGAGKPVLDLADLVLDVDRQPRFF